MRLVAFFALSLFAVYAAAVLAAAVPLNDEQAASIYALAYGQYHGKLPDRPPTIRIVPAAELCARYRMPPHCPVLGLYLDSQVLLSDSLDFSKPEDASVLLHEFIHYLQEQAHGPVHDCQTEIQRERQAYLIQAEVLEKAGQTASAWRVRMNARQIWCREPTRNAADQVGL